MQQLATKEKAEEIPIFKEKCIYCHFCGIADSVDYWICKKNNKKIIDAFSFGEYCADFIYKEFYR